MSNQLQSYKHEHFGEVRNTIGYLMEKVEELEDRIETLKGRVDDMDKDAIIKDLKNQVNSLKVMLGARP